MLQPFLVESRYNSTSTDLPCLRVSRDQTFAHNRLQNLSQETLGGGGGGGGGGRGRLQGEGKDLLA